jgi:uncharacterized protein (TIGR02594 family)
MALPTKYAHYDKLDTPKVWQEAKRHYGVMEVVGTRNNLSIMAWAKELKLGQMYSSDAVPWCGLFVGICIKRAGYHTAKVVVRAKDWLNWGTKISPSRASWMDVLVFERPGGGHVGFYAGENKTKYLVYGGNQSNKVSFTWIEKTRLAGVRRCPWKIGQPSSVVPIWLNSDGTPSKDEA